MEFAGAAADGSGRAWCDHSRRLHALLLGPARTLFRPRGEISPRSAFKLAVSQNGLWLRQGRQMRQSVIHALRVADQGVRLEDVIIFLYGAEDHFLGRIEAQ